jgi:hypothetical protein
MYVLYLLSVDSTVPVFILPCFRTVISTQVYGICFLEGQYCTLNISTADRGTYEDICLYSATLR